MKDVRAETTPIIFIWTGEVMRPATNYGAVKAGEQFIEGRSYRLAEYEGRSGKTHRNYFAAIKKGWDNLNHEDTARFPTPEHLRHWCLIQEGYTKHRDRVFSTHEDAMAAARWVRSSSPYSILKVQDNVVHEWVAQSQRDSAMDHKEFHESKQKVLGRVAAMVGVTVEELSSNTGRAA